MAKHKLRRRIGYRPDQLFDLVVDVERYPRFVPWWEAARVFDRQSNSYRTEQIIRFKVFRQQFRALTTFERPHWIAVRAEGGAVKRFDVVWHFRQNGGASCDVDLEVDLQLATSALDRVAGVMSEDAVRQMLGAFEREAGRLYPEKDTVPMPSRSSAA